MLEGVMDVLKKVTLWFGSTANRYRLRGARVEVIALIVCREPEASVLLGQASYHKLWMPPQEGVGLRETFLDTLHRCLRTECGLEIPNDESERRNKFYVRSVRYVGTLDLPAARHGERLVADDATGTPLEAVRLRKKAYWLATLLVRQRDDLAPKPDGLELVRLEWVSVEKARELIKSTNEPPKAELLLKCLTTALQDIQGAPRTIHPQIVGER